MMSKKLLFTMLFSLSFLILAIIISFSFTGNLAKTSSSYTDPSPLIVIDPGHGGEDGGASTSDNVLEKDINLQIGLKLKFFLQSNGFDVIMTRESDTAIYDSDAINNKKRSDLQNRVDIFNSSKNNVVISIHQNKFVESKYNGTQVFFSANNEKSAYLAENIRNSVVSLLQPDNERECKKAGSEIYILDNTQTPAVLVECGFLSNENESSKLQDNTYQNRMAYCICLGFMEYYYTNY